MTGRRIARVRRQYDQWVGNQTLEDYALRFTGQVKLVLHRLLPAHLAISRIGRFAGLLLTFNLVIGTVLLLIALFPGTAVAGGDPGTVRTTLFSAYVALFCISGIVSWLMVLAHESRHVAEEETDRQTEMKTDEIEAYERTYDQLKKAKSAAESANVAKSRYIVGVSHEIRAPLNAVFGYAQLLERDAALSARQQDAVRVIRRSSEHLSMLVDGLLDIAKIEAGRLQLNRDRIAFLEMLEQLVDMFSFQARASAIQFRHETQGQLPRYVFADEKRLRQILINLLSNAIKYTPRGHVTFRVHCRGQITEFEVADSGIGIEPADLERIFDPFERGSNASVLGAPGTGLGLTITKLLAQIMGGEVTVESTPGKGSVFRVRLMLPEAPRPDRPLPEQRRIRGYSGRRFRVLAADDDERHLELLLALLAPLGFLLEETRDGEDCLAAAQRQAPDLALLDLNMPGMGGWELIRRLQAQHPTLPIVIVSANADEQARARAMDRVGFVAKPIEVNQLLASIQSALGLAWVYDESELPSVTQALPPTDARPDPRIPLADLSDLHRLGKIGYMRGIETKLDEMLAAAVEHEPLVSDLRSLVRNFELKQYMARVEALIGAVER